jgi:hypothetical protein
VRVALVVDWGFRGPAVILDWAKLLQVGNGWRNRGFGRGSGIGSRCARMPTPRAKLAGTPVSDDETVAKMGHPDCV